MYKKLDREQITRCHDYILKILLITNNEML